MESPGSRLFFNPSSTQSNMLLLGNCDAEFADTKTVMEMEGAPKKRPFLCSPEDYFADKYYDEQLTEKKRRLTPQQVNLLEKSFEAENKLEPERKTELAKKLGLQPRQVAVWFQNRRARWKTKQLERDYDLLKSSYESLLSNYESILSEHHKLKSEVASLTEKLQTKDPESLQVDRTSVSSIQLNSKVEDRLSSGTAGSAVVDVGSPQLLDSGNSLFQSDNDYPVCGVPDDGIQSEDDGRSYFPSMFGETRQQQHEVEEPLGWWMWF